MKQSSSQRMSVLPAELDASRVVIQKIWLPLILGASIISIPLIIYLLKWLLGRGFGILFCVPIELVVVYVYSYICLRGIQLYINAVSRKRGYVCLHCHKPLFQPLSKDRYVEITGRCPSCKQAVVQNFDAALANDLQSQQDNNQKSIRKIHLIGAALIIIGLVMRYVVPQYSHEGRALDFLKKHLYDQAIVEASAELQSNPDNANALAYRGLAYTQKNMNNEARKDFDRALSLNPSNYVALTMSCGLWLEEPSYSTALEDCTRAIRIRDDASEPYLYRAAVYDAKGQYDLAEKDMDKAISLQPDKAPLYAIRGSMRMDDGRLEAAQKDFEKAASIDPNALGLSYGRGVIKILQGAYADAIKDLANAVKQTPSDPCVMIWLHVARFHAGQNDKQDLEKMAAGLTDHKWPSSAVGLYLGQTNVEAVRVQAATGDASIFPYSLVKPISI